MDAFEPAEATASRGGTSVHRTTTYKEFRNHFEKDRALLRRFQKISVRTDGGGHDKILAGLAPAFRGDIQMRPLHPRPL